MFDLFFKHTNLNFDKCTISHTRDGISVNANFISEDEHYPICGSNNLYKNDHVHKTVKHWIYIINFSLSYESIYAILDEFKYPNSSCESIAKNSHLTRQNIIDVFDYFYSYTPSITLPSILSFDEKHIGKAISDHKYLFIMVDWKNKKIYDILKSRDKNTLWKYFSSIPKDERDKVDYITIDMWSTYKNVTNTLYTLKNEIINSFININDAFTIPKKSNEAPTERRLSNGLIDGLNSNIEQIKINGKGYSNYESFKKRIIYVINKELTIKGN